jgi:Domain of unknown function (DUF5666)
MTTASPSPSQKDAVNRFSLNPFLSNSFIAMFLILFAPAIAEGQASPAQTITASATASTSVAPNSAAPDTTSAVSPIEPGEAPDDTSDNVVDPASLLPNLPPLPSDKISLVGGTIEKLDRVRDELTIRIFGGGRMKVYFDPRTRINGDGVDASAADLRLGDRVSIDTVLNGGEIFARSIRLKRAAAGETQGLVIGYERHDSELIVRDALSPKPLQLRLTPQTHFVDKGQPTSADQLLPGTLVDVHFGGEQDGRVVAREVLVLAVPGSSFTFAGRITGLDLSSGVLTLTSTTDGKSYEIFLDPSTIGVGDNLRVTANVTVNTLFDGHRYVARDVNVY